METEKTVNEKPELEKILVPAPGTAPAETSTALVDPALSESANAGVRNALNERKQRKGGGRHPKGCTCGHCVESNPNHVPEGRSKPAAKIRQPVIALPPVPVVSELDRQLAREAIKALTLTMDSLAAVAVNLALAKKDADLETRELANKAVVMPEVTRQGLMNAGAAVAEKYGVLKIAPEATLAIFAGQWLVQMSQLIILILKTPAKEKTPDEINN